MQRRDVCHLKTLLINVLQCSPVFNAMSLKLIDLTIGLRVSEEEEVQGVDIIEHGGHAYNDFQTMN